MTQPISFNPARAVGDKRIAPAQKSETATVRQAVTAPPASPPQLPLSKLTDLARQLAAEGPPFDNVRIAQLSQAIALRDFKVDAAAIADVIMQRMPAGQR